VGLGLGRAGVVTWGHAAGGEGRHGVEGSGGWDAGVVRAGVVVGLRGKRRVVSCHGRRDDDGLAWILGGGWDSSFARSLFIEGKNENKIGEC
jgi:hypothetical protein